MVCMNLTWKLLCCGLVYDRYTTIHLFLAVTSGSIDEQIFSLRCSTHADMSQIALSIYENTSRPFPYPATMTPQSTQAERALT